MTNCRDSPSNYGDGGASDAAMREEEQRTEDQRTRRVHISPDSILHVYEDDTDPSVWYTPEEIGQFKITARRDVDFIRRSTTTTKDPVSFQDACSLFYDEEF